MIIWILAILLVLGMAAIGYTQGAIRTGIKSVGLLVALILCAKVAPLMYPLYPLAKITNPFLPLFISPVIVFAVVVIVFKVIGDTVYQKVEVYVKHRMPDYLYSLWQKADVKFGLCFSVINAFLYLVALSMIIYVLGYPVLQVTREDNPSAAIRYLRMAARQLGDTKLDRLVWAFNPAPPEYYGACDILGLVYQNPPLWSRLTSYPAMLVLGQREEFQALGNDPDFARKLMETPPLPLQELLAEPKVQAITTNRETMDTLRAEIQKLDFADLETYLKTGESPKYAKEPILGRWRINAEASAAATARLNPKLEPRVLQGLKLFLDARSKVSSLVMLPDNQIILRAPVKIDLKALQAAAEGTGGVVTESVNRGSWESLGDGKYKLTSPGDSSGEITIDNGRFGLRLPTGGKSSITVVMVLDRED